MAISLFNQVGGLPGQPDRTEQRLGDQLEDLIQTARAWGRDARKDLRFRLARLTLQEKTDLSRSIRISVKTKQLELERISFKFLRHGIFLERGVGRGRPVGSAKARKYAKPWIEPTLAKAVPELAEMLADEYGDIAAGTLRFLVPGIADFKIETQGTEKLKTTQGNIVIDRSFF